MTMIGIRTRIIIKALFLLLFCSAAVCAADKPLPEQSTEQVNELTAAPSVPDLAEIVPLQIKLAGDLKNLQKGMESLLDGEQLETNYVELETGIAELDERLNDLRNTEEYKYNKLIDFRELLKQKSDQFGLISTPVSEAVRQLGELRKKWQTEAARWNSWQVELLTEGAFEQLRSTFDHATETNNSALDLILSELDALLALQERAGTIEQKLVTLNDEVDNLISEERRNTLFNDTPPMFTGQYLAQLKNINLWEEAFTGLYEISLPNSNAVAEYGWIAFLHGFVAFLLVISIRRRKQYFQEKGRWYFLALHPIASGVFLSYLACVLIYEYQGAPSSWKLVVTMIGGLSFARLMKGVVDEVWKAQFIYGLIAMVIITRIMDVLGFPIPIFRLYICIVALVGLFFCLHLLAEFKKENRAGVFLWLLRSGAWFLAVIVFFEIWGRKALASYLFVSSIRSLGTVLVFAFLMHMIHGALEWLFSTPLLRRSTSLNDSETETIVRRLTRFFDTLIVLFVIVPAILMIWSVYESLAEATVGVMNFGFNFGENRITIGVLVISATIIYCSYLISWIVEKMLIDQVLFKRRMEKGARISIARLVHYVIVVAGFLLAISALGIEITKLTIMISALGVGIGFGLQGIVNNFVSGLVLLFEQPIRVGDLIEINGMWGEIKRIGIRSTLVRNFDHADLILPNADLISNQVTNWTLEDRESRLIIGVGVAYGSNVELVIETLLECASNNNHVSESPSPQALFLNFGESTLDFELRVFVPASMRIPIRSELHLAIDKRFRENDITIAFPQRDLHVSVIESGEKQLADPVAQRGMETES